MAVVGSGFLCSPVAATPINGGVHFRGHGGDFTLSGGTLTLHFNNPLLAFSFNPSSTYAGVHNEAATFRDISLTFTGDRGFNVDASVPIAPLWEFTIDSTTYSFDLLTTFRSRFIFHGDSSEFPIGGIVQINGSGVAHATGFDDTTAIFRFRGRINSDSTFSSIGAFVTIAGVPELGASWILLLFAVVPAAILHTFWTRRRLS